ncbi:MAG: MoaD/ThiS family protein [Candidatus Korobacteraceae bacterium]|jgi:molybdopterin converting factor small subunit
MIGESSWEMLLPSCIPHGSHEEAIGGTGEGRVILAGITIKALGHISSLVGASEVVLDCDSQLMVSAILDRLGSAYPAFSNYIRAVKDIDESLLIVRNGHIENLDSVINPGDELILVTPVSGG